MGQEKDVLIIKSDKIYEGSSETSSKVLVSFKEELTDTEVAALLYFLGYI